MSILQKGNNGAPTDAQKKANRIKRSATQSVDVLVHNIQSSLLEIWGGDNTQDILDALGTDAKELFELNTNTLIFLNQELAGKRDDDLNSINALMTKVKPHTVNPDGSITLD